MLSFGFWGGLVQQRFFGERSCMAVASSVGSRGLPLLCLPTIGHGWEINDRVRSLRMFEFLRPSC